jgi:hypothetical protein
VSLQKHKDWVERWVERYLIAVRRFVHLPVGASREPETVKTTLLAAIFTAFLIESSKLLDVGLDADVRTIYLEAILQQLGGTTPPLPSPKATDRALNIVWFIGLTISVSAGTLCLLWARGALGEHQLRRTPSTNGQQKLTRNGSSDHRDDDQNSLPSSLRTEDSLSVHRSRTQDLSEDVLAGAVETLTFYLMGPIRYFILLSILTFYVGIVLRFLATDIKTATIVVSVVMVLICAMCYAFIKRLRKQQKQSDDEVNRV